MKPKFVLVAATAVALLAPLAASAQFLGKEDNAVTAGKMPGASYLAPKPTTPTPYTAPNKPHWKLSEILAAHKGQTLSAGDDSRASGRASTTLATNSSRRSVLSPLTTAISPSSGNGNSLASTTGMRRKL